MRAARDLNAEAPTRIFRFGAGTLESLDEVCAEAAIGRPLLVTSRAGVARAGELNVVGTYDGVRSHVPIETVHEVRGLARAVQADGLVALGGGSSVDTCKAVVAALAEDGEGELPRIVAVPTTYAGAEWTPFFGMLVEPGRKAGGSSARATPIAAIYDPELTLDLPLEVTVGTAMNALAHCAEAYYHPDRTRRAERHADTAATAIGHALPLVVSNPTGIYGRTRLLEGAYRAALALADSGVCLAHTMAQVLGGRYGLPQGAMNALCLPTALRFNAEVVPDAIARFGEALGADDAPTRIEELAALGGFGRLRDFGVPAEELDEVAAAVVERPGAKANPRSADTSEIVELLRALW